MFVCACLIVSLCLCDCLCWFICTFTPLYACSYLLYLFFIFPFLYLLFGYFCVFNDCIFSNLFPFLWMCIILYTVILLMFWILSKTFFAFFKACTCDLYIGFCMCLTLLGIILLVIILFKYAVTIFKIKVLGIGMD